MTNDVTFQLLLEIIWSATVFGIFLGLMLAFFAKK